MYEKSRFKRRSHHFQWCPLLRPCLYSCGFFYVNLYQRIYILVYYKQISSQCNLTTQIEPVQDKVIYQPLFEFEVKKYYFLLSILFLYREEMCIRIKVNIHLGNPENRTNLTCGNGTTGHLLTNGQFANHPGRGQTCMTQSQDLKAILAFFKQKHPYK